MLEQSDHPIYLDHAATMPLLPIVKQQMQEALLADYGNASSLHQRGHMAHQIVETARSQIARLINADPAEIIFTSGGSESNNTVMETFRDRKVAVSAIEHPSVLESAKARASQVTILPVDVEGRVSPADIPPDVDLVSVMLANNEIGTLEPLAAIAKHCKKHNIFVHTDATQAFGKIKIDVRTLGVDYMTLCAHKIGGPIGVGILYVKQGSPYHPLILGGHQENRRRAGTTNIIGIAGFGAAAAWCWDHWSCRKWAGVAKLRNELKQRILQEIPYCTCNTPAEHSLPHILNLSFAAAEGESIQLYLSEQGIYVGTGSACAAGDLRPSHVIMATKHDAEIAHNSIRFALGLDTTEADIERVMQVLPPIIARLRDMSTIKLGEKDVSI